MDFITCSHTKSEYKVSVLICKTCKRKNRCADYAAYAQPSLFPQNRDKAASRKVRRKKRRSRPTLNAVEGLQDIPEQLSLGI